MFEILILIDMYLNSYIEQLIFNLKHLERT